MEQAKTVGRLGRRLEAYRDILKTDNALMPFGFHRGWYVSRWIKSRGNHYLNRTAQPEIINISVNKRSLRVPFAPEYLILLKVLFVEHMYDLSAYYPVRYQQPFTILDLGANIGLASAYLSIQFPMAQFICVEPDPRNISLLHQTIGLNKLDAVTVEGAVGAFSGSAVLRWDASPVCSALDSSPMHSLGNSRPVEVFDMASVLATRGWNHVDLLEVDIEGAEDSLLSENNSWLHQVSTMLIEIHPNTSPERIAGYISPFGFSLAQLSFGSEPVYLASKKDNEIMARPEGPE